MKVFIILGLCLASALAVPLEKQSPAITLKDLYAKGGSDRIISGQPAVSGQIPWQVALQISSSGGSWFCGGSIISNSWILTAAHCAQGGNSFTIWLGGLTTNSQEDGRLTIVSNEAYVHQGYNSNLNNDVALIRLPSPLQFSDTISAVRLPNRGETVLDNTLVRISGWGRTSDDSPNISPVLNYVDVTTIPNSQCAAVYGSGVIIASTLCAVGRPEHSTCNGDSGGPLVYFGADGVATHHGIISFVHIAGCGSGNPSGYVRTEAMLSWIASITGLDV